MADRRGPRQPRDRDEDKRPQTGGRRRRRHPATKKPQPDRQKDTTMRQRRRRAMSSSPAATDRGPAAAQEQAAGDAEKRRFELPTETIAQRRRRVAAQRRKIMLRRLFGMFVMAIIVLLIMFLGYNLITWGVHKYNEYQAMYAGYEQRQIERRGQVDPRFDGYTNVLILGLDDGADVSATEGKKADTIMVASLDNATGRLRVISIPSGTLVNYAGQGETRLNQLYAAGGAPLMVRQIDSLLGISIHQYIAIDMRTFSELIDTLGGIDIYVETNMDYDDPDAGLSLHLKQGYQTLSGDQAQQYLRYRGSELGEFGRIERQQKFVKALYQRVLQLDTLTKLPQIARIFQNRVETSTEIFDSAHLANVLRSISSDTPQMIRLPGQPADEDDTIWLPDTDGIQETMQELFPPETLEHGEQ